MPDVSMNRQLLIKLLVQRPNKNSIPEKTKTDCSLIANYLYAK
jgi:hypothetical protein